MKILFYGESWKGSSARSLREGLDIISEVKIEEVCEDHYISRYKNIILRVLNRLTSFLQITELENAVTAKINSFKPDILIIYKGRALSKEFLTKVQQSGLFIVNVFPDLSPHAHGESLRKAIGTYDLVISTKPFHSSIWSSLYGYTNLCLFVPHGYDPKVHFYPNPPDTQDIDVVLAATWRLEYHQLMLAFASAMNQKSIRVVISGPGWLEHQDEFPNSWEFEGAFVGNDYCRFLRRGRIVIAPLQTQIIVHGVEQPGEQDTTRSYELAAAGCFFMHRRTPFIQTVYDEQSEVPMWDDAQELADLVQKYLPLEDVRRTMAKKAHLRAVPEYSITNRSQKIFEIIKNQLNLRVLNQ